MKEISEKPCIVVQGSVTFGGAINKVAIPIALLVFVFICVIAGAATICGAVDRKLILDDGFESLFTNEWQLLHVDKCEQTSNDAYHGTNSLHVVTKDGFTLAGLQKSIALEEGVYSVEAMVKGDGSVRCRYRVGDVAVYGSAVQLIDKWQKIAGKIHVFTAAAVTVNIGTVSIEKADFYVDDVRIRRVGDFQKELDAKTDLALNKPYKLSFKPWPMTDESSLEKFLRVNEWYRGGLTNGERKMLPQVVGQTQSEAYAGCVTSGRFDSHDRENNYAVTVDLGEEVVIGKIVAGFMGGHPSSETSKNYVFPKKIVYLVSKDGSDYQEVGRVIPGHVLADAQDGVLFWERFAQDFNKSGRYVKVEWTIPYMGIGMTDELEVYPAM